MSCYRVKTKKLSQKSDVKGAGEMAQQRGALTACSSVPSAHRVAHKPAKSSPRGSDALFRLLATGMVCTRCIDTHTCRQNSHAHKINLRNTLKGVNLICADAENAQDTCFQGVTEL